MMSRINQHEQTSTVSWKPFVKITLESLISFYIATFCVAMFYIHRGENWLLAGIILALLYLFVIVVCAKRVFEKLPMAAIFLLIPIAPLIALILVVSLIPLLQYLR
ncbi:hypothetical protein [Aquicella lusitana]|uniref:Uncharacterized protein n=1 Tax=Aquicella lusitana TaxID=254246 RepID=A0A370GWN4_9COXI|nr:hypothetical protein [Aquicella lusitana]RDI48095.1 hypothetical protein C8D86_10360 [Aquicella lusitana]VVC72889.1 hypothetical protein AQULUS_06130 [Aquicella lusitana]